MTRVNVRLWGKRSPSVRFEYFVPRSLTPLGGEPTTALRVAVEELEREPDATLCVVSEPGGQELYTIRKVQGAE